MVKLFSWLAGFVVVLILFTGVGVTLLTSADVSNAQQEAAVAIAKGTALAVSGNIDQINRTLDKMVQDPDVLIAVAGGNPAALNTTAKLLEKYLPGVKKISLFLPEIAELELSPGQIGFADLDMVRETLVKEQSPSVQGDKADRHLAITRKITLNGKTIGVILAAFPYEFLNKVVLATANQDVSLALKQGTVILASSGAMKDVDGSSSQGVNVANTDWFIQYQQLDQDIDIDFTVVACILLPVFFALLACFSSFRYMSNLLSGDLQNLMKAFKDLMTNTLQGGNYPFKLNEMSALFSNLMQFKRVLDNGDTAERPQKPQADDFNLTISDDDFDLDMF